MPQTKISTNTDFSTISPLRCSLRSRLKQKVPVTECLACCVCVLFSMAKSILRMNTCVRFCCHNILFLRTMCGEGSSRSVLCFCCCREIPFLNQEQTFGERISCVTRHDDFFNQKSSDSFTASCFFPQRLQRKRPSSRSSSRSNRTENE